MADASAIIAALAHAVLQRPEGREWTLQGFGMLRTYLGADKSVRLHVWDSRFRTESVSAIHDHPWDFTSHVVSGRIDNRRYVENAAGSLFQHVRIRCGVGGCAMSAPDKVRLWCITMEAFKAGDSYSQRAEEIHDTEAEDGTVSIIVRPRGHADLEEANVYWGDGPWVSAEPRVATQAEVEAICRRALERWSATHTTHTRSEP